jgi:O-glycosyl hydrolase
LDRARELQEQRHHRGISSSGVTGTVSDYAGFADYLADYVESLRSNGITLTACLL